MTYLSIIVPALGSQKQLDETLVSVLENRPPQCEVILVHQRSYVDPYDLGDEVRFVEAGCGNLVSLLNHGFAASRADFVHFLQPGVEVEANWCEAALDCFENSLKVGSVSPVILDPGRDTRSAAIGVTRATFAVRKLVVVRQRGGDLIGRTSRVLGPTLFAAFYRTSALRRVGGLDAQLGALADLDCANRLQAVGYRCEVVSDCRVKAPLDRVTARPRGFRAARCRERLYWRQSGDRERFRARLRYPISLLDEVLATFPRPAMISCMLGRCVGWIDSFTDKPSQLFGFSRITEGAERQADQAAYRACRVREPAANAAP